MKPLRVLMVLSWLFLLASIGVFVYALMKVRERNAPQPLPVFGEVKHDFHLTNQWGETLSLKDLEGKVWIAYFFFSTCPSICPIMNRNMVDVQTEFANNPEVVILGFTVDPETDTPERLRAYGEQYGVQKGKWHYLTGDKKTIYTLARESFKLGVEEVPEDQRGSEHDFIHSEKFILVDKQGRIRGYFAGTHKPDVQRLMQDIYTVLEER